MPVIKEMPAVERPREKLKLLGVKKLSNAELLAILIGTGTRNVSSTELAGEILALDAEGITYFCDCTTEELAAVSGVGIAKASRIVAAVELGKRIATKPRKVKIQISDPADVAALFIEDMRYLKNEVFKVLMLNVKNEIMQIESISTGNINRALVDARDVFRPAVKRGAASVILIHNHPTGNPEPSGEDVRTTVQLKQAGSLLGIKVLDHLIIGDGVYESLKSSGKM